MLVGIRSETKSDHGIAHSIEYDVLATTIAKIIVIIITLNETNPIQQH